MEKEKKERMVRAERRPSEKQIETQCLTWLSYQKNLFAFKVKDQVLFADGRYRRASRFAINGVSDIICLIRNGPVLFLEIKREDGKLSFSQKQFQNELERLNHHYFVVRSLDELREIIKKFV